jgi:8-oxo-dGTP pyrophosphatase MutT (NUDIX family)
LSDAIRLRHRHNRSAMTQSYPTPEIIDIDRAEIALEAWSWPFATDRSADIERYFAELKSRRPGVWNGRVLLLNRYAIAGRALRGASFETDYSSFITWRDREFPDPDVYNFFAAAVLRAADGGYLLGAMASYTAGAGRTYFPCGTPEPADVGADGMLDLGDNLRRELLEETGIAIAELDAESGWTVVRDRCFLGLMKRLTARQNADELRARIMRHIAADKHPELADIRIVRGPADIDSSMPPSVVAYLQREWTR